MVNKWRIVSYVNWFGRRRWQVWNPKGHLEHVGYSYTSARIRFIDLTEAYAEPGVIVETFEVPA